MKKIFALLLLLGLSGCDPQQYGTVEHLHADGETHFAPHYKKSFFQTTDKKQFSVEMLVKGGQLVVGNNAVDIIIHGQGNKDVEGAIVTVNPWMTKHRHGLMEQPVTIERGAGLYTVTGVDLLMAGLWELKVNIKSSDIQDSTSFLFPDVKPPETVLGSHPMKSDGGDKSLSDIDYSTSRISAGKNFNVSFTSTPAKIPLNRIHSWQLDLLQINGEPVRDAKIRVRGDMPAHGHGLPTQPIITGGKKPGQYMVEGMKFNMPGHWTVTFDLKKGKIADSVTFNLRVK